MKSSLAPTLAASFFSAFFTVSYVLPIPGLVFFSYLAPLPLFLLGLSIGLRPLYIAGLMATALISLFAGPMAAGEFFLFSALGSTFIVNRALLHRKKSSGEVSWYPPSLLLRDFTFACGVIMLLSLVGYIYLTQGESPETFIKPLLQTLDPQGHMGDVLPLLAKLLPVLPGFFAFSWGIMMLINGSLAQSFLIKLNKNIRPSPSFDALHLPSSFLIALGISLVLSFVGVGYIELIGKNAAFILTFPFFLVGIGVVHRWFHKTSYPTLGLTIFYFLLGLFLWPLLVVVLLGILKPWFKKASSSN
jgi:hypothetical protein